jgi:hypothetical protein
MVQAIIIPVHNACNIFGSVKSFLLLLLLLLEGVLALVLLFVSENAFHNWYASFGCNTCTVNGSLYGLSFAA